jgi:hypothetical protein
MNRCLVDDCGSNDPVKGCSVSYNNHRFEPIACEYGRFVSLVTTKFGHLGKWKFRSIGSYSDVLVATLSGKYGRVEIWGGAHHQNEVWAVPKSRPRCLMGTLLNLETVEMGCGRVGVQPVLDLGGEHQ